MPHIRFINNNTLTNTQFIDSKEDDIIFSFFTKLYNIDKKRVKEEYKIGILSNSKEFLLTIYKKDNGYFIKPDKITRIDDIELIKKSLNKYIQLTNSKIIFSNTNSIKNIFNKNIINHNKYLKNIDYFVNDFNKIDKIQIEIGFGSGRHLIYQALSNKDITFIGIEIYSPAIEQVLKQISIQNIENILILNYDARLFMEFIQSNTVEKIFLHFPVPWDKKEHRRVYSKQFINESLRILKQKGTLELRTDSKNYFDYALSLLKDFDKSQIEIKINNDLEINSKYEDRWKKQDKDIYDIFLISKTNDRKIYNNYNFEFKKKIDIKEKYKDYIKKHILEKDYFIHIQNIYLSKNDIILIKVTFGSFNKPVSKYIFIRDNMASYYQGIPLASNANIKAHNRLKEVLYND
jgi:tRNA (guanine-N7-)-methyltransferase